MRGARAWTGRLVNRLVVATVASGLTAGLLGAALLERSSSAAALAEARTRNLALAEQYAVRVDTRVDTLLDALHLVASRQEIATGAGAGAGAELRVVLRVSSTFDELVLHDRAGRVVAAAASRFLTDLDRYPAEPGLVDAVTAAGGGLVRIEQTPLAHLSLAVPVEDPPGNVVGTLVGRAPMRAVTSPLEGVVPTGDPTAFLVDDAGGVLVHRDRSKAADAFELERLGPTSAATFEWNGRRQLFAAARAERLASTVVVEQPEAAARAGVDQRRRQLLTILLLVVLAAVTGVIVAGEVLLRPLRPLTGAVERIRRGERGVRAGVGGHGEIAQLAHEVDRMAAALDRREDQLAQVRDLSLLVGSADERADVRQRITTGIVRLVDASAAGLYEAGTGSPPALAVATGPLPDGGAVPAVVAAATRSAGPVREPDGDGGELLAVALLGAEGGPLAVAVAHRQGAPFADDDEQLLVAFAAFAATAMDNARRLALQQELGRELQEAVDRRRDLISTITHEFRTPLACIEGFSTTLADGWDRYSEAERLDLVGRIGHHAGELDELVNRFLDFSVTEHRGLTAQVGTVALDRAMHQAVAALAPLLDDRPVEVTVPRVDVAADPTLLRRTLSNLLSNAVKYSPPGSPIAVRAAVDGEHVQIEVVDEGVGLSEHDAQRAFEPFWRGGPAATRAARGAGLGLALVAEYVRAMGGACAVRSELGRGSTFSFTVPLATVAPVPVDGKARSVP